MGINGFYVMSTLPPISKEHQARMSPRVGHANHGGRKLYSVPGSLDAMPFRMARVIREESGRSTFYGMATTRPSGTHPTSQIGTCGQRDDFLRIPRIVHYVDSTSNPHGSVREQAPNEFAGDYAVRSAVGTTLTSNEE
jgi:hypothetical protein